MPRWCRGIDAWSSYDEYGNPLNRVVGDAPFKANTGVGYGWVGAQQRATQAAGLILMGARIYSPTTGAFTSTDPVFGGNSTTYAYPQDSVKGNDSKGNLIPTTGFLNAERNVLINRGWTYDPGAQAWFAP